MKEDFEQFVRHFSQKTSPAPLVRRALTNTIMPTEISEDDVRSSAPSTKAPLSPSSSGRLRIMKPFTSGQKHRDLNKRLLNEIRQIEADLFNIKQKGNRYPERVVESRPIWLPSERQNSRSYRDIQYTRGSKRRKLNQ